MKRINITEKAAQNHEELWPGYQSKAGQTDPELIEVFDNFAFDEILSHDNMKTKTRVLMIMASTIGSNALTEFKMMVNAALNVGATPVEVKEIVYQAVPYVGKTSRPLHRKQEWQKVWPNRKRSLER